VPPRLILATGAAVGAAAAGFVAAAGAVVAAMGGAVVAAAGALGLVGDVGGVGEAQANRKLRTINTVIARQIIPRIFSSSVR
jgi:hypothetical protein